MMNEKENFVKEFSFFFFTRKFLGSRVREASGFYARKKDIGETQKKKKGKKNIEKFPCKKKDIGETQKMEKGFRGDEKLAIETAQAIDTRKRKFCVVDRS